MLLYNPPQSSGNTNEIKDKKESLIITKPDVNTYQNTDQNVCRFPATMHFSVKI